jgi:Phosphotransferase enzyme family
VRIQPETRLAPDPALPQRDLLLDIPAVTARLSRLFGNGKPAAIDGCERLRVNYQIGKSLRVLHRVAVDGAPLMIAARAFRDGRGAEAYRRAALVAVSHGPARPLLHDPDLDTVFWTFPNDRRLAHLGAVSSVVPELRSLVPGWSAGRLIAYAPEKSATLACLDGAGRILAYAKVGASTQVEHDFRRYEDLGNALPRSDPHLRLPRAIGYSARHRTLVLEPVPGRRLADADGAVPAKDLERLGAAVATLHGIAAPPATPAFTRFDADRLAETARLLGRVRPDVAGRACELAGWLTSAKQAGAADAVCLHGDIHPKNAILADGRITLIDIEDLAAGPAAADIGSLLAALHYLRCGNQITIPDQVSLAGAFLTGYAAVRPLPGRACLGWHTAAALFVERAFRAVTRVRPLGLQHLDELLGVARQIVTEACDV